MANTQLITAALAIADHEGDGPAIRAEVAETYRSFARGLLVFVPRAAPILQRPLTKWASTSMEVARHITETEPPAGIVIDYGPTNKQWKTARKAAEKICGHGLPESGD